MPVSRPPRSAVLRWALTLAVLAVVAVALADAWGDARAALGRVSVAAVLGSFVLTMASLLAAALTYRRALRAVGVELDLWSTLGVFLPAQLTKYVPGSLWPILVQAEAGVRREVPRSVSASAITLFMLCTIAVAGVIVVSAAPFLLPASDDVAVWAMAVIGIGSVALLLLLPPRLDAVAERWAGSRTGRVMAAVARMRTVDVAAVCGWAAVNWLLLSGGAAVLALALTGSLAAAAAAGLAFVVAWMAGLAAVLVPAGLGVREGVLVLLAAPAMGQGPALALAVLSRLVLAVADVAAAAAGAWVARHGGNARTLG